MKSIPGIFFIVAICFPLSSQIYDTIELNEVKVVSSIPGISQRQSGRSVSIITAEQIRQLPAGSIDEIIRYIPGLEAQSRNLYGVQTDYSMRGSTFNQVLVMIDGMRLNDPLTGHFNAYIPVPLSEVVRIEVIRGPATVMYGPDAVGGIINIITNNFSFNADSTLNITLSAGSGKHDLYYTDAGINRSFKKWQFGGGLRYLSSAGFPSEDVFRNDFNLKTATVSSSGMIAGRTRLSFRTAVDKREFSARRFYTISPADTAREEVHGWWNHFNLFHTGIKSITGIDLAYKAGGDRYRFNSMSVANEHTTGQFMVQIRNNRNFAGKIRVTTGIHGNFRAIESNDRGDHAEFFGGIYSLAFMALSGNLHLSGGARLESDRFSNSIFLPQLNLAWNNGPLTLRSLAGKTMRTPDFTERYVSTNLPVLSPGRNLGNPSLKPESSWSLEAGGDLNLPAGINTGFTLFTRKGMKLIDYVFTPAVEIPDAANLNPDGSYFYARNIEGVNTRGIELTVTGSHRFSRGFGFEYYAGYTFQESVNPAGELSKYLSNQAKQLFVHNLFFTLGRAGLGFNGIMKMRDSEFAESINVSLKPSYGLLNMQGSFMAIPGLLWIEMRVENLFNTEYSDILGAKLPGRWISGGVKVRLQE